MNYQQALLTYNELKQRWEGEDPEGHMMLWISDATFQHHVWEYLAAKRIYEPTLGDVERAREYCRHWSYWQTCTDRGVHRN